MNLINKIELNTLRKENGKQDLTNFFAILDKIESEGISSLLTKAEKRIENERIKRNQKQTNTD